jgi:hypothetical protein
MILFQIRGIQYFAQVKPIYDNHTWRHRRLQGEVNKNCFEWGRQWHIIANIYVFISPIYQYSWYCTISNESHSAILHTYWGIHRVYGREARYFTMCVPSTNGEDSLPTSTLNGDASPYKSATTEPSSLTLITLESTHTSAPQSTANHRQRHTKTKKNDPKMRKASSIPKTPKVEKTPSSSSTSLK